MCVEPVEENKSRDGKRATRQRIAGQYEVLRPLGRGGMGKVFLVRDLRSGQKLALKMLRGRWQDSKPIVARFEREVQALRQLDHPCIVKVFDARRDDDLLYFTMEYIEGRSVREWLQRKGQLDFPSVVRVLCLVARALEHAHRITIHRDISPDNVMVTAQGEVRLLDFGLAKLNDVYQGLTLIGSNMGKMQYNAPEQRLNAAEVDHRADIYPLGIMFFEMLTGRRPEEGEKLTSVRRDLPRSAQTFFAKATADHPKDRFQSAHDFHEALLALYREWEQKSSRPSLKRFFGRLFLRSRKK